MQESIAQTLSEAGHHGIEPYWWLFAQRQLQQESDDMTGLQRTAGRIPNNAW